MTIKDFVAQAVCSNREAFAGLSPRQSAAVTRAIFSEIVQTVDAMDEGVLSIAGLGQFRVRQVAREVDGETVVRKQVIYRAAKAKSR